MIRGHSITTVVVWKLDRISRRQREGINLLAEWCERGVRVVVITQQLDLSGAVGRLVAGVLFGLAEIEQEYRQEWQAAGIAVAKRKGRYHGRAKGTTKAQPTRARLLYDRGCTVGEITLSGISGEIFNGKRVCVFSRRIPVSFISAANPLMRRCLVR